MADKKGPDSAAAKAPEGAPQGEAGQGGESMTKIEAVRRAVEALGPKAHRSDIQSYIKSNFGVDMEVDRISTVKAEVLRKARQKKSRKPAAAKAAAAPKEAKPHTPPAVSKASVQFDDILKLKDLMGRISPDQLRKLIEVMGK
jgi:hypothetical protein